MAQGYAAISDMKRKRENLLMPENIVRGKLETTGKNALLKNRLVRTYSMALGSRFHRPIENPSL